MKDNLTKNPLLVLGVGIGLGATALWAAVEFLPLLLIGGGIYLAAKGLTTDQQKTEEG